MNSLRGANYPLMLFGKISFKAMRCCGKKIFVLISLKGVNQFDGETRIEMFFMMLVNYINSPSLMVF